MTAIYHLVILALIGLTNAQVFYDLYKEDFEDVKSSRDFTGKVALVTGSSSGIGEGIVKVLSALGAQVVVTGRNATEIQIVAEEVQQLSPKKLKPLQIVADLTKDQDVEKLLDETVKTFGRLDILVNNAGIGAYVSIEAQNFIEIFDSIHKIDLRAPALLNHLSVPHLKATNGTIIHISSITGLTPFNFMAPYSMAKSGMDMMTRCLALELGPHGIRVNSINPGGTESNFKAIGIDLPKDVWDKLREESAKKTPLRRVGEPLDIARGVAFLASSDASFITGANLVIDGGALYTVGGGI